MVGVAHPSYGFGAIVLAGGVYAYVKKASMASLASSAILSGLLFLGGYLLNKGEFSTGYNVTSATSAFIAAFGMYRYVSGGKPIPSIPLLVLGTLSTAYHVRKLTEL